jgi:hypothetical protein
VDGGDVDFQGQGGVVENVRVGGGGGGSTNAGLGEPPGGWQLPGGVGGRVGTGTAHAGRGGGVMWLDKGVRVGLTFLRGGGGVGQAPLP